MIAATQRLFAKIHAIGYGIRRFGVRRTLRSLRLSLAQSSYAMRIRVAMFRLARCVSFHRTIDITDLWNRAHPHLHPLPQQPGFLDRELLRCPSCGEDKAVRILAHVRLGEHGWAPMRCVLSCYSCHRFHLPVHELLVPRAMQMLRFQSLDPTSVDARLWTDASRILNLEPTTVCNFKCWYCIGREMKQEHLTYENFVKIIDGFPSLRHLELVGEGEPIMNKRFFDMVKYAKARNIRVGFTSNGSTFSQSNVRKICEAGVDYVQISIDASDPSRYAESRVGGNLEKIWNGIERLITYRKQLGLNRPVVVVRGTLFPYSKQDIPKIVSEAKKRGVDAIGGFQTLNSKESYVAIYPEDKKRYLEDSDEIGQWIRKDSIRSELPLLAEIRLHDFGEDSVAIWPNRLRQSCDIPVVYSLLSGDVTPCCQIKSFPGPSWNLAKRGTEAVLHDEQYENMRFNLWNGFYLDNCQSCRGYTLFGMAKGKPQIAGSCVRS